MRFCPECGTPVTAFEAADPMIEAQAAEEPATEVPIVEAQAAEPMMSAPMPAETLVVGADAVEAAGTVADAVKVAAEAIVQTVDAPVSAGETVLSTWQSAGAGFDPASAVSAGTQAVGTVIGQAQKAAQETQPIAAQVGQLAQPAQPVQTTQEMPAQQTPMTQTEQFKSHRPTGRYASSGGGSRPAAEKKKSKLPVVLVAVGAAILVAAFALYVVPLFIPHPYDPNSHVALTSDSSSSASGSSTSSTSSSEGSSGSSSSSSNGSASSSASASSSSSSASSSSSTSGGSPTATGSYSTDERPKIGEFKWMTGETDKGNAPAGAARITDFGKLTGGWKAYMYGGNLERLLNVTIDAGQSGAQVTLDWYYIRDNKQDKAFEDTTASSTFTGTFDGGMLDAMGSGRITLTAFWEQDGHQYATGSFMWPSGETEVIALVRP